MNTAIACCCLSAVVAAGLAFAEPQNGGNKMSQPATSSEPAGTAKSPGFSTQFLSRAAQYCLAEIQLSRRAEQKAYSVQVEDYARKMLNDYGKIFADVKQVAGKEGIELPTKVRLQDLNLEKGLIGDKPVKFDLDYMNAMTRYQQQQADDFEHEATNGRDPNVKELAKKDLPIVKAAYSLARSTYTQVFGQNTTARAQYK